MIIQPDAELETLRHILFAGVGVLIAISLAGSAGFFLGQRAARGAGKLVRTLSGFGGMWLGGAFAQLTLALAFLAYQQLLR